MMRKEAIELLVKHELARLQSPQRQALLLDWWSMDEEDPDYSGLPALLKTELAQIDEPRDPMAPDYEPLLEIALRRSYVGVINSFLEKRLAELGHTASVEGEVEVLACCPSCRYRSLQERGNYEICRVCFWEDDGTTDLDRVSGPNHMTLREARSNVTRIGAVSQAAVEHVLPDGTERYARDEGC